MCDVRDLYNIASIIRKIAENNRQTTTDPVFEQFPKGACGHTAELFARYLRETLSLDAQYVGARRSDGWTHAWVVVDGVIIDITADQFGEAPIIVSHASAWHEQWAADAPRLPNCSQEQWPLYPVATWTAILVGMSRHGCRALPPTPDKP
jgi:hypothetical protein